MLKAPPRNCNNIVQLLESAMGQAQFELQLERVIAIKKKKVCSYT